MPNSKSLILVPISDTLSLSSEAHLTFSKNFLIFFNVLRIIRDMKVVSRKDALLAGSKRYFTGKPCNKNGHLAERLVSDYHCMPCTYMRIAKQRAADPKKFARRRRKWNNRAAKNEQKARRKARKRNQVCQCCTSKQVESIYRAARQQKFTVDHIIPLAKGGRHCLYNMQLLSHIANSSKGARYDPLVEGAQYLQNLGLA